LLRGSVRVVHKPKIFKLCLLCCDVCIVFFMPPWAICALTLELQMAVRKSPNVDDHALELKHFIFCVLVSN
jgi:hypothetical protein